MHLRRLAVPQHKPDSTPDIPMLHWPKRSSSSSALLLTESASKICELVNDLQTLSIQCDG